jgi:hypothetical protein
MTNEQHRARKESAEFSVGESGWIPEPVWEPWRRENYFTPAENRIPIPHLHSPLPSYYTDDVNIDEWLIPFTWVKYEDI